jgi:hypothetical protein
MNELVADVLIFDREKRKGISIDFVRTGQKIRNGKIVGCYKAIVEHLTEEDLSAEERKW